MRLGRGMYGREKTYAIAAVGQGIFRSAAESRAGITLSGTPLVCEKLAVSECLLKRRWERKVEILLVVWSTAPAFRVLFCAAAMPGTRRVNSREMANMIAGTCNWLGV